MDKYEYKLKLDQMKSLTAEHNYEKAAEIKVNKFLEKIRVKCPTLRERKKPRYSALVSIIQADREKSI